MGLFQVAFAVQHSGEHPHFYVVGVRNVVAIRRNPIRALLGENSA